MAFVIFYKLSPKQMCYVNGIHGAVILRLDYPAKAGVSNSERR